MNRHLPGLTLLRGLLSALALLLIFFVSSVVVNAVTDKYPDTSKVNTEESSVYAAVDEKVEPSTSCSAHVVEEGEYLTLIAYEKLGNAYRYPEIVELNKDKYPSLVLNPNYIDIAWNLTLPGDTLSEVCGAVSITSQEEEPEDQLAVYATDKGETKMTDEGISGQENVQGSGKTADNPARHIPLLEKLVRFNLLNYMESVWERFKFVDLESF